MNDGAEESYDPLIRFMDILNNAPDDEFEAQIQTIFDVEFFLRYVMGEGVGAGGGRGGEREEGERRILWKVFNINLFFIIIIIIISFL